MKYAVMGISTIGSMAGLAELLESQELPHAPPAGWRHLSLPASMVLVPDWLAGWERFSAGKLMLQPVKADIRASPPKIKASPESSRQEIPFRLFGILSEGSDTVYCLFDKSRQRWIRLASGQMDSVSGIRVRGSVNNERIEDMETGKQYSIDRDQYTLVPDNSYERLMSEK